MKRAPAQPPQRIHARISDAIPTPARGDTAAHTATPIAPPADAAPSAAAVAVSVTDTAPEPAPVTTLVESEPVADLYVDGKKRSRTPAQLAGTRGDVVRLELRRNGYHTLRQTVTLTDEPVRLEPKRRTRGRDREPPPQPDDAPPSVDFIPGRATCLRPELARFGRCEREAGGLVRVFEFAP